LTDAQLLEIDHIYGLVASLPAAAVVGEENVPDTTMSMRKENLVQAAGEGGGTFRKLAADPASGAVSREEWGRFLRAGHAQKGRKEGMAGDRWLHDLMLSLRRGVSPPPSPHATESSICGTLTGLPAPFFAHCYRL